jgi:hypothetical protein
VATVKKNAFNEKVDGAQVDQVLDSGSPAERVLVFGVLQARQDLATVDRLHHGISESQSGNEQYHALLATRMHWSNFPVADQKQLRAYIQAAPNIKDDPDRKKVADEILATGR